MIAGVSKSCIRNKGEDDCINDMGEYNVDDDPFID